MAVVSYPNVTLTTSTTTLQDWHNGAIITSTQGSSVNVVVTAALCAGFQCQLIQNGTGQIWVTAGSGATVNSTGAGVATSARYAVLRLIAMTDGAFALTGNVA